MLFKTMSREQARNTYQPPTPTTMACRCHFNAPQTDLTALSVIFPCLRRTAKLRWEPDCYTSGACVLHELPEFNEWPSYFLQSTQCKHKHKHVPRTTLARTPSHATRTFSSTSQRLLHSVKVHRRQGGLRRSLLFPTQHICIYQEPQRDADRINHLLNC